MDEPPIVICHYIAQFEHIVYRPYVFLFLHFRDQIYIWHVLQIWLFHRVLDIFQLNPEIYRLFHRRKFQIRLFS